MSVLRFVTVHTNPLAVVHVSLCCVCVKLPHDAQLTAAGRVVSTHTPVLCSTVVDAARNGESGSQAHCPCTIYSPRYQHPQHCGITDEVTRHD